MERIKKILVGILASTTLLMSTSAVGAVTDSVENGEFGYLCPNCGTYTGVLVCGPEKETVSVTCSDTTHANCSKTIETHWTLLGCTECTYLEVYSSHDCVERHRMPYGDNETFSICPYR